MDHIGAALPLLDLSDLIVVETSRQRVFEFKFQYLALELLRTLFKFAA